MDYQLDLPFNSNEPTKMHVDFNSCFASIEQQANPLLRGKPVAVAAYTTPSGCILAASVEAKKMGVKTGLRVKDGKALCPELVVLAPDPWKYRKIHLKLRRLISDYTKDFSPKSIDEFVLDLAGYPAYKQGVKNVALEIKERIRQEIGEWLKVSIGIGPNRFLAKTAASLKKPDGLERIDISNFEEVYKKLALVDLCGINTRLEIRLHRAGIYTVSDFAAASLQTLRVAFESINSYYWYLRLRGWEIDAVETRRKSFGNSYSLPKALSQVEELSPVLAQLVNKATSRMRRAGFKAHGVALGVMYRDSFWHKDVTVPHELFDSRDVFRVAFALLKMSPGLPVRNIAISCFSLEKDLSDQLALWSDVMKRKKLIQTMDRVNKRWGEKVLTTANTLSFRDIPDRISFGGVRELVE